VLQAVSQELGLGLDEEFIRRIAFGFGGGIGGTGAVCGAVVGGVMALGLVRGGVESEEEKLRELAVAGELRRRFEAEMGTIGCRELTEIDLTTEEGLEQYRSSDLPQTVCHPAAALAYRFVLDLSRTQR